MIETNLPILYLREVVLLPFNEIRLEFTDNKEKNILDISSKSYDSNILLVNLVDPLEEAPLINDLAKIGILAKIKSRIDLPNGMARVVLRGIDRVEISSYIEDTSLLSAFVVPTKEYDYNEVEASALKRVLYRKLDEYIDISPYMSNTVIGRINDVKNISKAGDTLLEIVNNILDITKIEEGKMSVNNKEYCLADIIAELTNMGVKGTHIKIIDGSFLNINDYID